MLLVELALAQLLLLISQQCSFVVPAYTYLERKLARRLLLLAMTLNPRIVELAATISDSVAKLQQVLSQEDVPSPSFAAPYTPLPSGALTHQDAALDAASELYDLLLDPLSLLFQYGGVSIHELRWHFGADPVIA